MRRKVIYMILVGAAVCFFAFTFNSNAMDMDGFWLHEYRQTIQDHQKTVKDTSPALHVDEVKTKEHKHLKVKPKENPKKVDAFLKRHHDRYRFLKL